LESLHHKGLLERTHSGALPLRTGALQHQTLCQKQRLHKHKKLRIAEAPVRLIGPGQVIILDSGTIITAIARGCRHVREPTIISSATNITADLSGSNIEVILTDGTLHKDPFSLVGPLAGESLRHLKSRHALSCRRRIQPLVWPDDAQSVGSARQACDGRGGTANIVVCDLSKFGRRSLSLIMPVAAVHETITHRGISRNDLKPLRKAEIEVTLA